MTIQKQSARAVLCGAMASCLLSFTTAASAADAIPQTAEAAHQLADEGIALVKKGDVESAAPKMRQVLASPAFADLALEDQYYTWAIIGVADLHARNPSEALAMLQLACASPLAAHSSTWVSRLSADEQLDDDDGVGTLLTLASASPQLLPRIRYSTFLWAVEKTAKHSDGDSNALIQALSADHWPLSARYVSSDIVWFGLARLYLHKGDVADAAAALNDVHDVGLLIAVRSEKVFDPVVAMNPSRFDIAKASDAEIARYTQWTKEDTGKLEAVTRLAKAYIVANRPDDALNVIDPALARLKNAGRNGSPFTDAGKLNWLLNARSDALLAAGRYQEALDALASGARQKENGSTNASQSINLAALYLRLGRPSDALASLGPVNADNASPFGLMEAASVKAWAYAQLSDSAKAEEQLAYMRVHASDNPEALLWAYLHTNHLNDAAAGLIALLQNPKTRWRILIALQDYAPNKSGTPVSAEDGRRVDALLARRDVADAITAVGRIQSYPVQQPDP